jgi:type I restriction enzyme, R subunit
VAKEVAMTEELEWKTRRDRINKKLTALNPAWQIIKFKDGLVTGSLERHAVEEYPTANGPADYALFVKGKLLGILEAKKVKIGLKKCTGTGKTIFQGCICRSGKLEWLPGPFFICI